MKPALIAFAVLLGVGCTTTNDPIPRALDAGPTTRVPEAGGNAIPSTQGVPCGESACTLTCCLADKSCTAAPTSCAGPERECDEAADCPGQKCCAELASGDDTKVSSHCRSSCITNVPRVQVCRTNADCTEGSGPCKDWSCASVDAAGLLTCGPLGTCP